MIIRNWKQALGLGFLSWLLPFAISFAVFPLKRVNAPLFETAMSLVVVTTAALLARRYFRRGPAAALGEAVLLGFVWLAVNLALDYPMFAYGPMRMSAAQYYSEIGAGYLLYPAFLSGTAWIGKRIGRSE
jgi:hypothetical protein